MKQWPGVTLILEGDGALKEHVGRIVESEAMPKVICLDGGMESGLPSVMLAFQLPDGTMAVCQTSARAFVAAARGITARWPEVAL